MNSIYNLKYDYIQQNGSYLILSHEDGFTHKDLNEIQIRMIQSNSIPKLLLLEIEEMDFNIRLRYHITSNRLLNHLLKSKLLTVNQYYNLLFNIVSVIADSKIYMLDEQNYILDQDFIFIGKDFNDIYLTYLPIKTITNKGSLINELKTLATNLVSQVEGLKGNDFQELMNTFNEESFNITKLKQKLLSLINSNYHSNMKIPKPSSPLKSQKLETDYPGNDALQPLTDRQKTFLLTGSIFIIAVIWRFFLDYHGEGLFYISIGLTLLVLDIDIIIIKLWRPRLKRKTKEEKMELIKKDIEPKVPSNQSKTEHSLNHYRNLHLNTTLLSKEDETVLLNHNHKSEVDKEPKVFLEVTRDSEIEQIYINRESFIIGRNPTAVQYVENTRGISRVHLEVLRLETGYAVRDLGSRNGSFLNHQELITNKIYPIKEGDVIKLAKIEFTFKVGA